MPDSAVNDETLGTFLLDGDMPRLAAPPTPTLPTTALAVTPDMASFAPPPPGSAPLLVSSEPTLPTPTLASPVLPGSVQVLDGTTAEADGDEDATPAHPMAHLMPGKIQPTESSLRAAQVRAEKKAKARKKKIIALVVVLAIGAAVGPPLARWLVDAINEAGSTTTEEEPAPATTVADTATTVANATSDGVTGGASVAVGAPSQARDAVDATNAQTDAVTAVTPAP